MSRFENLTGKIFGRLTVIKRAEDYVQHNGRHRIMWECKCECGNIIVVRGDDLKSGHTKTCGCSHFKHGLGHTRIYSIYKKMKSRCINILDKRYKDYGGRGIKICDEWLSNPLNFYQWAIDNGYKEDLTIDRIDVNGDYEPKNCRWTTYLEQGRNTRRNFYITYKNETHCLSEWSEILGINYGTLKSRIKRNKWSIEKAFTTPTKKSKF